MMPYKNECKILDLKSKDAGLIEVELIPLNASGKPITDKDGVTIRDPKTDLANKPVSFQLKINSTQGINPNYEDIYCQFQIYKDPVMNKTDVIRGTNNPNFKYSKQFTFQATPEVKFTKSIVLS